MRAVRPLPPFFDWDPDAIEDVYVPLVASVTASGVLSDRVPPSRGGTIPMRTQFGTDFPRAQRRHIVVADATTLTSPFRNIDC